MKYALPNLVFSLILVSVCGAMSPNENTIYAVRTSAPPVIDGIVDDEVWEKAGVTDRFIQNEPDDGKPATERTELRVLYDDSALYISMICFDSEPEKIVSRLTRRDRQVPSDYVQIGIDSYYDRTTAFVFEINAAGVKRDYIIMDDGNYNDASWDGLWDAAVAMREDGWSAEFRIPYQTLRFSEADEQIWGFNATRKIDRKSEYVLWAHVPQGSRAVVSRFGVLRGLENLTPPRSLLIVPYILTGATRWPGDQNPAPVNSTDPNLDVGVDIQYGITNNTTLNLTVNPDFGQVELDEVILNLSAFETFYEERRPFFVEGASIYRTVGPMGGGLLRTHMFYSRRIGAQPSRYHHIPDTVDTDTWMLKNNPSATPILGAVKISSQSGGRWAGGLMNVTTGRTYKTLRSPAGGDVRVETEPFGNYTVGRVRYDLDNPGSYIGGIVTSVLREHGVTRSFSGGMDWYYNTENYSFVSEGLLAMTSRNPADGRQDGYHAQMRVSTLSHDHIHAMAGTNILTKDFNPNDIGFNTANNIGIYYAWFGLRHLEPYGIIRRINYSQFSFTSNILDSGVRYLSGIEPYIGITWMNYWSSEAGANINSASNDPFESRGMGIYRRPASTNVWFYSRTDNRKPVIFAINPSYTHRNTHGRVYTIRLPLTIRAGYSTEITFSPSYQVTRNIIGWVSNTDEIPGYDSEISVFGRRDVDQINTVIRLTHTFNPNLTLQGYVQYFWARGEYHRFYMLEESGNLSDLPNGYDKTVHYNPDFNRSAMNVNLIFRYEYRPGSTIFLVWTHSKNEFTEDHSIGAGSFFNRTLESPSLNIVMLKWTYAIGL